MISMNLVKWRIEMLQNITSGFLLSSGQLFAIALLLLFVSTCLYMSWFWYNQHFARLTGKPFWRSHTHHYLAWFAPLATLPVAALLPGSGTPLSNNLWMICWGVIYWGAGLQDLRYLLLEADRQTLYQSPRRTMQATLLAPLAELWIGIMLFSLFSSRTLFQLIHPSLADEPWKNILWLLVGVLCLGITKLIISPWEREGNLRVEAIWKMVYRIERRNRNEHASDY
jgi:hypothetical protein